jgi:hypothetical protein
MTARTVIHLGGAKTASTTLQTAVLSHAPAIYHFGEGGDGVTTIAEERVIRALLNEDEALCDFGEVSELFERHRQLAGDRTLVFSSADVLLANRPTVVASRLRELLGADVELLLVVRNQLSALSSLYSGHGAWLKPAPQPYFRRFVPFADWLDFQWLSPATSALGSFAYWEQLQPFISAFGGERLRLVPFEQLVKGDASAWGTVGELFELGGQEAWQLFSADRQRERISVWQKRYGQVASLVRPFSSTPDVRVTQGRITNALARGPRFTPQWPVGMEERISGFYRAGNGLLSGRFNLRLGDLHYPMPLNGSELTSLRGE